MKSLNSAKTDGCQLGLTMDLAPARFLTYQGILLVAHKITDSKNV